MVEKYFINYLVIKLFCLTLLKIILKIYIKIKKIVLLSSCALLIFRACSNEMISDNESLFKSDNNLLSVKDAIGISNNRMKEDFNNSSRGSLQIESIEFVRNAGTTRDDSNAGFYVFNYETAIK